MYLSSFITVNLYKEQSMLTNNTFYCGISYLQNNFPAIFTPMHHPEENPWKITAENEIYTNPWITLTEYQVLNPAGNPGIYGKVHFKNYAIGVLPLDDDLNTYLVGQYRFPLQQYSWEMPE